MECYWMTQNCVVSELPLYVSVFKLTQYQIHDTADMWCTVWFVEDYIMSGDLKDSIKAFQRETIYLSISTQQPQTLDQYQIDQSD